MIQNNIKSNTFHNVDCLSEQGLLNIKDKSISLIIVDLPFGTTQNEWDSIIPLNDYIKIKDKLYNKDEFLLYSYKKNINIKEANILWQNESKIGLWTHYNRIIKDNGAILLFAQKPFDTLLHNSNIKDFRYEWIWEKTQPTGHLNANKMPMKSHENILVFYKSIPTYNPQKTLDHKPMNSGVRKSSVKNFNYNMINQIDLPFGGNTDRFPRSIISISSDKQFSYLHPTQKPIELYEYFIKTYTNKNDVILDHCSGSGTLAIACYNLINRNFICMEKNENYYYDSIDRFEIHKILFNTIKNIIDINPSYNINQLINTLKTNKDILSISNYKNGNNVLKKINKNIINIIDILKRNNYINKN